MFNNIYRGRRVLITGHTGFKGSWLTTWLIMLGADVAGFSKYVLAEPSTYLSMGLANKINDFTGSIRDKAELQKKINKFEPEIIFHLATQEQQNQDHNDPVKTFESNILDTLYMLESTRQCPTVKVFICVTNESCYRNNNWIYSYREDDYLGGNTPYSASTACVEHIAQAYFASFFKDKIACATVRAGNIMGGGDWSKNSLIPNCVRAWDTNEYVSVANTKTIYPWLYVLEPLSGYLHLAAKLFQAGQEFPHLSGQSTSFSLNEQALFELSENSLSNLSGQAYNFGSRGHESHSVAKVIKMLSLHLPKFKGLQIDNEQLNEHEEMVFKLCTDKALTKLQWRAVLDFEETLRYTAEWYSAYYSKKNSPDETNMFSYTIGQISAYENAAANRGLLWTN